MMTAKRVEATSETPQFEAVLKYPLMFLGLGGVLSGVTNIDCQSKTPDDVSKSSMKKICVCCMRIYIILIGAVNISCFAKAIAMIVIFRTLDKSTVEETVALPFCTFVWLSATYVFNKYFPILSAAFLTYERKFGYTHNICRTRRKAKIVTLVVIALHSCVKIAFGLAHMIWLNDSIYTYPFKFEEDARMMASVFVTLIYFLVELAPYYLLVFYVFVVHILASEFRGTRDEMSALFITLSDFDDKFDFIRARHLCLQEMVEISSLLFRSSVVITFVFNFLVFCFLIYLVSNGTYTTYGMTLQIIAAVISICGTLSVTVAGGSLHTAAHSICDAINNGDWMNLPVRALQKMNLFLTQFATKKIGFNIYGLFMIDTTTLLMITGTVLTYGVVYLQFAITTQQTCQTLINQMNNGTIIVHTT